MELNSVIGPFFGLQFGRTRLGAKLRLCDVSARDLTGGEPVAGLPQRRLEHVHVAALKFEDGGRLQKLSSVFCSVVRSTSRAEKTWPSA